MALDFQRARPLLQSCDLTKLFIEELGWGTVSPETHPPRPATSFTLPPSRKTRFCRLACEAKATILPGPHYPSQTRPRLAQTSCEHLIVFATRDYAQQSWMRVRRNPPPVVDARTVQSLATRRLAPEVNSTSRSKRKRQDCPPSPVAPALHSIRARHQGVLPRLRHPSQSLSQVH